MMNIFTAQYTFLNQASAATSLVMKLLSGFMNWRPGFRSTDSGEETTPWLPSSLGIWDSLDESSSFFSTKAFANAESFSQIDMSEAKMALFSFMKETKKLIRANNIAPPAIRKSSSNLSSGRLSGSFKLPSCSERYVSTPNHFSSILIIASLSVTRNIALETSGTRGDPLGNACRKNKKSRASRVAGYQNQHHQRPYYDHKSG
nr:glutamate receptor, ionotropic, plant [Ipomoea batatas]GME01734.1 glutamate receptor, ionotropic, plant [Ipomoea batatas]